MAIANREEVFSHHIVDAFESGAIALTRNGEKCIESNYLELRKTK